LGDTSVLLVVEFGAFGKCVKVHEGLDDRDDAHPNSKGELLRFGAVKELEASSDFLLVIKRAFDVERLRVFTCIAVGAHHDPSEIHIYRRLTGRPTILVRVSVKRVVSMALNEYRSHPFRATSNA
jgi:hypothetical protein